MKKQILYASLALSLGCISLEANLTKLQQTITNYLKAPSEGMREHILEAYFDLSDKDQQLGLAALKAVNIALPGITDVSEQPQEMEEDKDLYEQYYDLEEHSNKPARVQTPSILGQGKTSDDIASELEAALGKTEQQQKQQEVSKEQLKAARTATDALEEVVKGLKKVNTSLKGQVTALQAAPKAPVAALSDQEKTRLVRALGFAKSSNKQAKATLEQLEAEKAALLNKIQEAQTK